MLQSLEHQVPQMPQNNLNETVIWLSDFCSTADGILKEARSLVDAPQLLVTCPFDPRHSMPATALLQHSLRCPSSPTPFSDEEAGRLVSSLRYSESEPAVFDPSGAEFWYKDAPATVRAGRLIPNPEVSTSLPPYIDVELESNVHGTSTGQEFDSLLPSQCWLLQEEVKAWTEFPRSYSWNVLVSVMGTDFDRKRIREWLLVNSVKYGVVLDPLLADYLFVLVRPVLAAVRREALSLRKAAANSTPETAHFGCPMLVEAGSWLVSQLVSLYQPQAARAFVLSLLQNCLIVSARTSALELEQEKGSACLDRTTCKHEFHSAFRALQERVGLQGFLKTRAYRTGLTKDRCLEDYEDVICQGAQERQKRQNYRPILEHDGLIWHRRQSQDSSSAKTKEELLADERDYKRRRASYKGKKVRRSTSEVIRDIIENHMNEIVDAGGIGCLKGKEAPESECRVKPGESHRGRDGAHFGSSNDDGHYRKEGSSSEDMLHRYAKDKRDSRRHFGGHDKDHVRSRDKYTSGERSWKSESSV